MLISIVTAKIQESGKLLDAKHDPSLVESLKLRPLGPEAEEGKSQIISKSKV